MSSPHAPTLCLGVAVVLLLLAHLITLGVQTQRLAGLDAHVAATRDEHAAAAATHQHNETVPHKELAVGSGESAQCPDTLAIMHSYCGQPAYLRRCFDLVAEVETLLLGGQKQPIFDALAALEPQPGPIFYWAVDEASENEDSHLDLRTEGIAEYFDNAAYYYAQERHRESARCGGWSLSFWRRSKEENGTRSLQLAYCEDNAARVRVCGAFDVLVDGE